MEKYNKFTKGSEWRKWDLHIHTPKTKINDNFKKKDNEDIWKTFCTKIEKSDVSVFGITDYFSVENYFIFIEKHKHYFPLSKKVFFPNIELRLEVSVNKSAEEVNIHIIFSNSVSITKSKIEEFLLKLDTNIKLNDAVISCKNLTTKSDYEKAGVKHDFIRMKLKEVFGKDECYLIIAAANNTGLRPDTSSPRKLNISDEIDKVCDGFFGSKQNIDYYLNTERYETQEKAKPKPVISGCDAHSFNDIDNYLGKKVVKTNKKTKTDETIKNITWIKADPTFDGLRQIKFEPEDRIAIQENKPEEKAGYHVIDLITLNEDEFWKQKIHLNENLNTIIGGRATGKSNLLKILAKKINTKVKTTSQNDFKIIEREKRFIDERLKYCEVKWKDDEVDKQRDIDYFPQSYMYELASDNQERDNLIRKIIKDFDTEQLLENYQLFLKKNKTIISNLLLNIFSINEECIEIQKSIKQLGDRKGVESEITSLTNRISNSKISISVEVRKKYESISKIIFEKENRIKEIVADILQLKQILIQDIFDSSIQYSFSSLSENLRMEISYDFDLIKKETELKWKDKINKRIETLTSEQENLKKEVEEKKRLSEYQLGVKSIKSNDQYKELSERITIEQTKLIEVKSIENKLKTKISERDGLLSQIIKSHLQYKKQILELKNNLSITNNDIEIQTIVNFNKDNINKFLTSRLNQMGGYRQNFISNFTKNYEDKTEDECTKFLKKALRQEIDYKAGNNNENVVSELLSTNWFEVSFDLIYQNDAFDNMSQGKQAFVILKLLLEFSNKKCPILIDQPEDSLDNRAIYNELVKYIVKKKKERQIILVTHNANVVVSADAEQIIVANQNGHKNKNTENVKFQYVTGSLEHTIPKDNRNEIILLSQGIREHVCEILEGGNEAFKKRENKYNL